MLVIHKKTISKAIIINKIIHKQNPPLLGEDCCYFKISNQFTSLDFLAIKFAYP